MPEAESRSLHLHTLDSLIADLASGRSVQTGRGMRFVLPDDRTRSALEWYRKKGPSAPTKILSPIVTFNSTTPPKRWKSL